MVAEVATAVPAAGAVSTQYLREDMLGSVRLITDSAGVRPALRLNLAGLLRIRSTTFCSGHRSSQRRSPSLLGGFCSPIQESSSRHEFAIAMGRITKMLIDLFQRFDRSLNTESELALYGVKLARADEAYLFTVFKPAGTATVEEVGRELDFPPALYRWFDDHNGAVLFRVSPTCPGLRLFGCQRRGARLERGKEPPATDIRTVNRESREVVAFGGYSYDGSFLLIDRQSEAIHCCYGREVDRYRMSWDSLSHWMDYEFERLSRLFRSDGICLTNCQGLLPGYTSGSAVMKTWRKGYATQRGTLAWPHVPITLYSVEEIPGKQKGYIDHGWQPGWVVIGHDDLCGDPIFVDTSEADSAVLTAAHGEGSWEAVPIAKSLGVLIASMTVTEAVYVGNDQLTSGLAKIAELNVELDVDIEFWRVLMERWDT